MTSADRLAPILDFRTDTDDPITEDHVHSFLLTHPVKGILINGAVAYDEIASFLNFCHPSPVPIALVNHPRGPLLSASRTPTQHPRRFRRPAGHCGDPVHLRRTLAPFPGASTRTS